MEQKFVNFEDAVEKLGISSEQLTRLRETGALRAYRDGASWKFRGDEIQKMVDEGVPEPAPPSDIGLASDDDLVAAEPLRDPVGDDDDLRLADDGAGSSPEESGIDLVMADDAAVESGELDDDTVTAGSSDVSLESVDEGSDPSDSILLSEEELGESLSTPPSTIIGKNDLEEENSELDLALPTDSNAGSDTRLADGASDVLSSGAAVLGETERDDAGADDGGSSGFDDLEDLQLDLADESSTAIGEQAQAPAPEQGAPAKEGESDLDLDDEGTDPAPSDLGLAASSSATNAGPTSDLELATDAEDEDFVLAESGGSDITMDSSSSGINLDPSDSGLALDDISLDVGGSAILSSLSLENEDEDQDISLVSDDEGGEAELSAEDSFDLTPMSSAEEDDDDSSSQVIALDAEIEGTEDEAGGGILDEDAFAEADDDAVVLSEDYAAADADALGVSAYPAAARADSEYTVMNIVGLGCCALVLLLGMVVMLDMARNIWSWDETYALNSWLLDGVLGLFGN